MDNKYKILANDGIDLAGKLALENAGFIVDTEFIPQDTLTNSLNEYQGIIVRSATKVRKELIDANPQLKFIARAGVGMDNIDVDYAISKAINVINTPAASSRSVAELVFAHLFGACRFLPESNRRMAEEGGSNFNGLKKTFAAGTELFGKTIGIIGFGRIGQEVGKIAQGIGMKVVTSDLMFENISIKESFLALFPWINIVEFNTLLSISDHISIHVPGQKNSAVIGHDEFEKMKDGVGIVNCARGGVINEVALIEALDSNKVRFACLDVFENEPTPSLAILHHPKISLTPHIGASTAEAQERIGDELAEKIIAFLA